VLSNEPILRYAFIFSGLFLDGGHRTAQITNAMLYMLAKDNLPFSTVEAEGFKTFMATCVPLYKIPSRRTVTKLVDDKYDVLAAKFKSSIANVKNFVLTTDAWTETMTTRSYLGVTCHFLNGSVDMSAGVLGVYELNSSHTADYLASVLVASCQEWGIKLDDVVAVVTDNGANIVKAVGNAFGSHRHLPCFAHTLNLVPQKAIKNTVGLPKLIDSVKAIVTFSKQSVAVADDIRREQLAEGKTEGNCLKLMQEVPTRWNSLFYMLERFVLLSRILSKVLIQHVKGPDMLTGLELENVRDIVALLRPLEVITRELSGEHYVTCSKVIPLAHSMKLAIQSMVPNYRMSIDLQRNLLAEIEHRFQHVENVKLLSVSTLLDPRFKRMHFESPVACAQAVSTVQSLMLEDQPPSLEPTVQESTPADRDSSFDLWGYHNKLVEKSLMAVSGRERQSGLHIELQQYLRQHVSSISCNPLLVWADLKPIYPALYKVAIAHLSILATSVPSERLFSKAGNTITQRRNRLTGKRLSKLLFLNSLDKLQWGM
jgi:zinc finger BED domain-containing protein 1 (E3 SUMO-protein ligase ZBED1)